MEPLGLVAALLAVGCGLLVALPLRRHPQSLAIVTRLARWLAAVAASVYFFAFTAAVAGAGDLNAVLLTLALGLGVCAALLWRGPRWHLGRAGHCLAALWLLYSGYVSRSSPGASALFVATALPALFAATAQLVGGRAPGGDGADAD